MFSNLTFKSISHQIQVWKLISRFHSTIYALSSGHGKSAVAIFRISGSKTNQIFQSMIRFQSTPKPRMAYLKTLYDPETGDPLDKGLILWFPEPKSFTGEDMCELQIHGSKAVIEAVSSALSKLKDFRPAEPGEFTKRAFEAGKLSLTEVEGLSDLIDAETEMQRKQALNQMDGCLEQLYAEWRKIILENVALTEAFIDFSEDQNIEDDIIDQVDKNLRDLVSRLQDHLGDGRKGEILRDGVKTVIIGSTNVGKSSLLNLLCRRPAAIVTEIAGTTRDVVQGALNINGYPVLLSDTAGIRQEPTQDVVEREGIRRSFNEASKADLLLLVLDAGDLFSCMSPDQDPEAAISSYLNTYTEGLGVSKLIDVTKHLVIFNKCDLLEANQLEVLKRYSMKPNIIGISCKSSFGVPSLLDGLTDSFKLICGLPNRSNPSCSRERHRHHLKECEKFIVEYLDAMNKGDPETQIVLAAEKLRQAVWHLGMISGTVATDEVLSVIFKQFCVGK